MDINIRTGLTLLILFTFNKNLAQKISLSELHQIASHKNWETSNHVLLSKGWEYYNSSKGDSESYNTITWSYDKTEFSDTKATAWLYMYTYDGLPNKVMYRFRKKDYYLGIKAQLAVQGYKLKAEEILDDRVVADYNNANFILELTYARENGDDEIYDSGSFTSYQVTVFKKGGIYDPDNGPKQEYFDNGTIRAEYTLKDGEIHGLLKSYDEQGNLSRTVNFINGIKSGNAIDFYYDENQSLVAKYQGSMKDDLKIGKWQLLVFDKGVEKVLDYTTFENDIEHGPFTKAEGDSLVVGNYRNGQLDGKYNVFIDVSRLVRGGIINTDTLSLTKVSEGSYARSKKEGYWRNYHLTGNLSDEGIYREDLKEGVWKFYYNKFVDENNVELEYSKELFLEETYRAGKLDGIARVYSYLEKIEKPCEDPGETDCFFFEYRKRKSVSHFKQDELNGPFELWDENDELIAVGQYLNGMKTGFWKRKNVPDLDFILGYSEESGNYLNGRKEGEWKRHVGKDLVQILNYQEDFLHGPQTTFINKIPRVLREFKSGSMERMQINDSIGNFKYEYQILNRTYNSIHCILKEIDGEKVFVDTFSWQFLDTNLFSPTFFHRDFWNLNGDVKIRDGKHSVSVNAKLLEEGSYHSNNKSGEWNFYYYDQGIKVTQTYNQVGEIVKESFGDIRNQGSFTGEFIYKPEGDTITQEIKIKNGLRHGTTRYRDASNKTIKKESYKEGILKR